MLINQKSITNEYVNIYSLQSNKIGMPIFQRFFDWKEKQFSEILNDIENSIDKPDKEIYLLDFIWYEEDEKMMIADGQQRLVSLNILIKCIKDYAEKNEIIIDNIELFDVSYDNTKYNDKYVQSFYNYMGAPFKKIYFYLYNYIKDNPDNIATIIDIIKNKIFIYLKKTSSSDDAFDIFTQINTGGKPLSKDEVIKITIDQYADLYKVKIAPKFKELKKTIIGYYKYINNSSNSNFDTIAIMSFLKNNIVNSKSSFNKFVDYLNIVSKISDYSISYIISFINRASLSDILNVMAIKNIDVKKNKEYLNYIMLPLCLLSIVMTMKKVNPGGIIQTLYSKVISMIKEEAKPVNICNEIATFINKNEEICKISFNDFKEALGKKDLKEGIKKAILIIDVISRTTSSDLNVPSINLEHIYPQNPAPEWAINNWPTDREKMNELIHNIGNYLLLNEKVNKRIQNKYISVKVAEYKKIIPNDIALNTELNSIDFDRFEKQRGNYILERQTQIANAVYYNFRLGSVIILK